MSEDLASSADSAYAARGSEGASLRQARRMVLEHVAARHAARLLHFTEALGTPLTHRLPRLVTCHDLIELRYWRKYLKSPLGHRLRLLRERRRYRSADHVVAISRRTATDAIEIAGVAPDKIHVILHGVDLRAFGGGARDLEDDAKLSELGLAGVCYVVYAGGADWRKNVAGMLRALAVARRRVGVDLVWAGELSPREVRLAKRAAHAAGVEGHVRLLGYVRESHMPALFRAAKAHLFLSRLEGFGLSVIEAMAVGCPVVLARGNGSDEITGESSIVVDPDDASAAGDAIAKLVEHPGARARHAELGLASVGYFDRDRMAKDYAALYAKLVPRR